MKLRNNFVLLKGTTKTTTQSGIVLPGAKSDNIERKRYVKSVEVLEVGDEVKDLKKGDQVVVLGDTLMKLSYNVIHFVFPNEAEQKEESEKGNFYIIVPEDEIKAVI